MTYCLGILTKAGLIMAADSRTSAGVDYVSNAQKLFDLSLPGERVLLVCTAGNLSMTQSIMALMRREQKEAIQGNIDQLETMFDVATYFGRKTRQILDENREWMERDRIEFNCTFLLGGQLQGESPELYMVYSQGNFLRATKQTPFLQIGEIKYGKPILDRTIFFDSTTLDESAKCALLSLDSTMKSNISVGPPIHLAMYETDTLKLSHRRKFEEGDLYLTILRKSWEESVRKAFKSLPDMEWEIADVEDESPSNWLNPANI